MTIETMMPGTNANITISIIFDTEGADFRKGELWAENIIFALILSVYYCLYCYRLPVSAA